MFIDSRSTNQIARDHFLWRKERTIEVEYNHARGFDLMLS
jgi:hypothetical protein